MHRSWSTPSAQRPKLPTRRTTTHRIAQRLTEDQIGDIVAQYQQGVASTAIAENYHVSKHSIVQLLRSRGVPIRKQPMTDEALANAVRLYKSGQSLAKVGNALGYDPTTIRNGLIAAGVARRDTQGRPRR